MSDSPETKLPEQPKTDEQPKAAAKAAQPKAAAKTTFTLKHDGAPGDVLSIGATNYPVTEGMVEVAPEHLEAALQAGWRPA